MADRNRENTSAPARQLTTGAWILGILLLLGALLGLLWWGIAPRAEGMALGGGEVYTGTTELVFAGEGYFALITAATGLIAGYTAYMLQFPLARRRFQDLRMVLLVAGALGSLGGSLLTWRVGVALDASARAAVAAAEPGTTVETALQLNATAFLLVWPLLFVLQYGLLDAISLVRRDQPGVPAPVRAVDTAAGPDGTGEPEATGDEDGTDATAEAEAGPVPGPEEFPSHGEPTPSDHDRTRGHRR